MLINFQTLSNKYPQFKPNGVVHVGAHEGQELNDYLRLGIQKMIFIEAIPEIYKRLEKKCSGHPEVICFNECISDEDGKKVTFNIADNNGQSSSFLQFGTHKQMHPDVSYNKHITLETVRLDTLLNGIEPEFDFLNMDLQGAEGHALRGLGDMLHQFKYLYLEVNKDEVYKGCMQFDEMHEYLKGYGFEVMESYFPRNCTWGDCFFIKHD